MLLLGSASQLIAGGHIKFSSTLPDLGAVQIPHAAVVPASLKGAKHEDHRHDHYGDHCQDVSYPAAARQQGCVSFVLRFFRRVHLLQTTVPI